MTKLEESKIMLNYDARLVQEWEDSLEEGQGAVSRTQEAELLEGVSLIEKRQEENLQRLSVRQNEEREREVLVLESGAERSLPGLGIDYKQSCPCDFCLFNKNTYQRLFRFIFGRPDSPLTLWERSK